MRLLLLVPFAALILTIGAAAPSAESARPAHPFATSAHSSAQRATGLRKSIRVWRARTWRYQDLIHRPHIPTNHAERRWKSVAALHWLDVRWIHRARHAYRASRIAVGSVQHVICATFHGQTVHVRTGGYVVASCRNALHIAWGESRDETTAANVYGYVGLFQLGTGERATYATIGYSTAYEQTVAAFNLFRARGWEPWTCCGESSD